MEWLVILGLIAGGYWWYQNKSPQAQNKRKAQAAENWIKEADEAYGYLSSRLKEYLEKDVPNWVKEAKENLENHKKNFPKMKAPDLITYQPEKQAARKKEYQEQLDELNRVKDKFLRVALRYEHSKDSDMKLENIYDWHQWIVRKARAAGWLGWAEGLYKDDDEMNAWNIKYQEIEKRFDDRLK
jgi:hypothetical protein